jgi:hypothetical protein
MSTKRISAVPWSTTPVHWACHSTSGQPVGRLHGVSHGGAHTICHRAAQGPRAEEQRKTIPQDSREESDARNDPHCHA